MSFGTDYQYESKLVFNSGLILFILAAAIYIQSGHGTAPYDAVSF